MNVSVDQHFAKRVFPDIKIQGQFFSQRYLINNNYFHSSASRGCTPNDTERKRIQDENPHPLLTSLCNGTAYAPYEKKDEILEHIAYDVETKSPMYWNQLAYDLPGQGMRLVVDLDSDTRVLSDKIIIDMARVLWTTLIHYYSDFKNNPIRIFVAKCGPRIKKSNLCTGVHIVAHVKVSVKEAKQILFGYKLRLLKSNINMEGVVVDDCVYKEKTQMCSLRMIYSHKLEKCPICKDVQSARMQCSFCAKDGIVVSTSTYEPLLCLNDEGNMDTQLFKSLHDTFKNIVQNYSIWVTPKDERNDYAKPIQDPDFTIREKYAKSIKSIKANKRPSAESKKQASMKKLKTGKVAYTLLEEYLQRIIWNGKQYWEDIEVDSIKVDTNGKSGIINVKGLGSTACLYVDKEHGSNRIWFALSSTGVLTQRCHSEKDSACQQKERIKFQLPGNISNDIFGITGPPSLYDTVDPNKPFNFNDFVRNKSQLQFTTKPVSKKEEARQNYIQQLQDFYKT